MITTSSYATEATEIDAPIETPGERRTYETPEPVGSTIIVIQNIKTNHNFQTKHLHRHKNDNHHSTKARHPWYHDCKDELNSCISQNGKHFL